MEPVVETRPSRSFVRRFAVPSLLLAVLAGGGWGAYRYLPAGESEATAAEQSTDVVSLTARSAKDGLKDLFAANESRAKSTETIKVAPAKPVETDRYASTPNTESQPVVAMPKLPPAAPSTAAVVGNRYATPTPAPMPPSSDAPVESEPDTTTQELFAADVTRGQEPDVNPLRGANVAPMARDNGLDARTAFANSNLRPTPVPPMAMPLVAPTGTPDPQTAALRNARPLQKPGTNDLSGGRYSPLPIAASDGASQSIPAFDVASVPAAPLALAAPTMSMPMNSPSNMAADDITPTPGLANNAGTGRPGERLLEGAQSPSLTIQKLAPAEIQVGRRCTFAIRIQNTGQRTAQNVEIHDEVPLGTELVGTAPRAEVSGSHVVWNLGMLSVGEERTVEMELIPTEEGELGSVATVTLAAQASAKARCTRPELALRLSCQPRVLAGQKHLVQIEVSNPGSGDATGVVLLETVPPGVTHEAGPALEFEIGTLRPGESRRSELMLTATQAGRVTNLMTARADASLQIEASCEFEVIAPELQLSVEGPQKRYLERPATYQVSVNNPGTATAKDIQLVTQLPKGMQFVSANNMGEYDSAAHSVYWSLAELPAQERGTVELVALPIESGEQTLQVAAKTRQGLEDRTEKRVMVEGLSAVTFEVTQVEGLIEVGGDTTYEIRVANQGSKAAANVQVVAVMPPGMRALSGRGETRHTIQGERVTFAPLPQLAPKAETTFRIEAQGVRAGDQRVRVQVITDEIQQPITKEVSTRVYADQ